MEVKGKIKISAGQCSFLEGPEENLFPYLYQFLDANNIPWLMTTLLHLQRQELWAITLIFLYSHIFLCFLPQFLGTL